MTPVSLINFLRKHLTDEDNPKPWYKRWYSWAAVSTITVGVIVLLIFKFYRKHQLDKEIRSTYKKAYEFEKRAREDERKADEYKHRAKEAHSKVADLETEALKVLDEATVIRDFILQAKTLKELDEIERNLI